MLFSTIVLPCFEIIDYSPDKLNELFEYISKVGLITPLILKLYGIHEIFLEGKSSIVAAILKQLVQIAACHIEGVPIPVNGLDDKSVEEFAIMLLDHGAISIIFETNSSIPTNLAKKFIAQLPRTRVGISIPEVSTEEIVKLYHDNFKDLVSYFHFR